MFVGVYDKGCIVKHIQPGKFKGMLMYRTSNHIKTYRTPPDGMLAYRDIIHT